MVEFNNPSIRVRCLECKNEHFIKINHKGTEKEQRNISFEYEHIFYGELTCFHCDEKMKLLITIFEYPKGIVNYIDIGNESCLEMERITKDSLNTI